MFRTAACRAGELLLLLIFLVPLTVQGQSIKVTLLGTGSPTPAMDRFGPSVLVEAGAQKFLFDAGRGALQRLAQIKVQWRDVQGTFLTHLHSDHLVGIPDLWLAQLRQAFEYDLAIRQLDDRLSPEGVAVLAEDIGEGFMYDRGGVKITVFEVDHKPVKPAFGYRIDHAGRSVVLSGDTAVSENLIRHAQSVDLLVHEVASPDALRRAGIPQGRIAQILAQHVSPEQAAEVFSKAKPRLAVYSHITPRRPPKRI